MISLYVVKNDKGEWLYSDEYTDWVDQLSQATFYDTFEDADDDIEGWELSNAYIVELIDKPAPVVVSEEEAGMLEKAKHPTFRPSFMITEYSNSHKGYILGNDLEDRLMRAYVNGYTVAKEKKCYVKVPHTQKAWYYQYGDTDLLTICPADKELRGKFTDAEIEHYGLQDCEKVECDNDGV